MSGSDPAVTFCSCRVHLGTWLKGALARVGLMLDSMISKAFSNLKHSVNHWIIVMGQGMALNRKKRLTGLVSFFFFLNLLHFYSWAHIGSISIFLNQISLYLRIFHPKPKRVCSSWCYPRQFGCSRETPAG